MGDMDENPVSDPRELSLGTESGACFLLEFGVNNGKVFWFSLGFRCDN